MASCTLRFATIVGGLVVRNMARLMRSHDIYILEMRLGLILTRGASRCFEESTMIVEVASVRSLDKASHVLMSRETIIFQDEGLTRQLPSQWVNIR